MKYVTLTVLLLTLTGCATTPAQRTVRVIDVNGGAGSAFAIGETTDAYIALTAAHVLIRPEGTGLTVNDLPVTVIREHPYQDIAMISIPKQAGRMVVFDTARAELGPATAIGHGGISVSVMITHGEIISLQSGMYGESILADLRVAQGMSGGCLLQNNKAVGVVAGVPPGFGGVHTGLSYITPVYFMSD